MAWSDAARKAAAAARKRRTSSAPKPKAGDIYGRAKSTHRQSIAAALKWGRNYARGIAVVKPNPSHVTRDFMHAFMDATTRPRLTRKRK